MITEHQFQVNHFRSQLKEIDLQLAELAGAAEDDRPGHLQLIHELIDDLESEFRHVMIYREGSGWPVHAKFQQYQEKINKQHTLS